MFGFDVQKQSGGLLLIYFSSTGISVAAKSDEL